MTARNSIFTVDNPMIKMIDKTENPPWKQLLLSLTALQVGVVAMAVAALFSPYELARALFTINIGAGNQPCEYYAYFSLWGGFECDTVKRILNLGSECSYYNSIPYDYPSSTPGLTGPTDNNDFINRNTTAIAFVAIGVIVLITALLSALGLTIRLNVRPSVPGLYIISALNFVASICFLIAFPVYSSIVFNDRNQLDGYAASVGQPGSVIVAMDPFWYVRFGPGFALCIISWVASMIMGVGFAVIHSVMLMEEKTAKATTAAPSAASVELTAKSH